MIRLILLITLILFIAWIIRPFLTTKETIKTKNTIDRILDPYRSNFRHQNTPLLLITALVLLALFVWLLPKFGINVVSLLQKIVPLISSLRGILPF